MQKLEYDLGNKEAMNLNKKQIKIVATILQLCLIGALFLPAGRIIENTATGDSTLSVFGMIARYAGMGFSDDALFYMILACIFPSATILCLWLLKDRKNFGIPTVLNAFYLTASVCFYTAATKKMVDYATMTELPYLIVTVSLASMLLLIFGFLATAPVNDTDEDDKKG